jgi:hypothetical protein
MRACMRTAFSCLGPERLGGSAGAHGSCGTGSKYNGERQVDVLTEGALGLLLILTSSLALVWHICHASAHD